MNRVTKTFSLSFQGLDFASLHLSTPPCISSFIPEGGVPNKCWVKNPDLRPGADNLDRLMLEEDSCDEEFNRALRDMHSGSTATPATTTTASDRGVQEVSKKF